jgi:hypothetical protein
MIPYDYPERSQQLISPILEVSYLERLSERCGSAIGSNRARLFLASCWYTGTRHVPSLDRSRGIKSALFHRKLDW